VVFCPLQNIGFRKGAHPIAAELWHIGLLSSTVSKYIYALLIYTHRSPLAYRSWRVDRPLAPVRPKNGAAHIQYGGPTNKLTNQITKLTT